MRNLTKYHEALKARAEELRNSLTQRQSIAIETDPDELDRTIQSAERDLAISTLDQTHRKLREVEAALARIKRGSYGRCLHCDEPISERRLEAIPWAAFCLDCQAEADQLHERVLTFRPEAA